MSVLEHCDTCGYRGPEGYQCKFCDGANLKAGEPDIRLNLNFAERSIINVALDYYKPVGDADRAAWEALKRKIARTKCGDSGCSYCGDDYDPGGDDH